MNKSYFSQNQGGGLEICNIIVSVTPMSNYILATLVADKVVTSDISVYLRFDGQGTVFTTLTIPSGRSSSTSSQRIDLAYSTSMTKTVLSASPEKDDTYKYNYDKIV